MSAVRDTLGWPETPIPITVSVLADGTPSVDQDAIEISSTKDQQVQWVAADPSVVFHICFEKESKGSPFERGCHFHSSDAKSGKIRAGATGKYKYSVEVNGKILDPTIIVQP